jgi:hypothetical protein
MSKACVESKQNQGQSQQTTLAELNGRYDKFKKKLHLLISLEGATTQSRERSISIIETDIPRTFPMLGFFK